MIFSYFSERRLKNFTIGLTDLHPYPNLDPLKSPFQLCTTHGALGNESCDSGSQHIPGTAASLTCAALLYAWGRYLFIAANVDTYFHLTEVEVFDGRLI